MWWSPLTLITIANHEPIGMPGRGGKVPQNVLVQSSCIILQVGARNLEEFKDSVPDRWITLKDTKRNLLKIFNMEHNKRIKSNAFKHHKKYIYI